MTKKKRQYLDRSTKARLVIQKMKEQTDNDKPYNTASDLSLLCGYKSVTMFRNFLYEMYIEGLINISVAPLNTGVANKIMFFHLNSTPPMETESMFD